MIKKSLALMLAVLFCICSTGCGSDSTDNNAEYKDNDSNEQLIEDESEVLSQEALQAYHEILVDNEDAIKGYHYQLDSNNEYVNEVDYDLELEDLVPIGEVKNKCVAIEDINEDGIPELLFMSESEPEFAELSIYTFDSDSHSAVECEYNLDSEFMPDGKLVDSSNVTGLSTYMVYTGQNGSLYIATACGQESWIYQIAKFSLNDNGILEPAGNVKNKYGNYPANGEIVNEDDYYLDGELVSNDEGAKVFNEYKNDFSKLLIFSGFDEAMSVFELVKEEEPVAMSYDDMLAKTEKN